MFRLIISRLLVDSPRKINQTNFFLAVAAVENIMFEEIYDSCKQKVQLDNVLGIIFINLNKLCDLT